MSYMRKLVETRNIETIFNLSHFFQNINEIHVKEKKIKSTYYCQKVFQFFYSLLLGKLMYKKYVSFR